MIKLIRTNFENPDFRKLVTDLDSELSVIDGEEHEFYSGFNKIAGIKYVVVAFNEEIPVGCGAIKDYKEIAMEVKRMYVSPAGRNKGLGTKILLELEKWAKELSYNKCVLETGIRQPDAIRLYEKNGYLKIPNYGQYVGVENSVCYEKII